MPHRYFFIPLRISSFCTCASPPSRIASHCTRCSHLTWRARSAERTSAPVCCSGARQWRREVWRGGMVMVRGRTSSMVCVSFHSSGGLYLDVGASSTVRSATRRCAAPGSPLRPYSRLRSHFGPLGSRRTAGRARCGTVPGMRPHEAGTIASAVTASSARVPTRMRPTRRKSPSPAVRRVGEFTSEPRPRVDSYSTRVWRDFGDLPR